jgi:DNA polymerase I-like protein with 3'-5' exonuclease and polymerase domains
MSDFHQLAADLLTQGIGVEITRSTAKTIGFAALYNAGPEPLSEQLGCTVEDASKFLAAYKAVAHER